MKIKLIFKYWGVEGVANMGKLQDLYNSNFHGGTTWNGTIDVSVQEWLDLEDAIKLGFKPVFEVVK